MAKLWELFSGFFSFLESWNKTTHVVTSILIASFFVNLLSLAFPLVLLQVYDRIIPNEAISTLVLLISGVTIALILEAILSVCRAYVSGWADARFEHIMGCKGFDRLMDSVLNLYHRLGPGIYLKRMSALSGMRDFYAGQAIVSLADLPFVVILMLLISLIGGWLVLVPLVMLFVLAFTAIEHAKSYQQLLQSRSTMDDRRTNFIIETLNNIHTVKAISMEAQMVRRYERLQKASSVQDYLVSIKNALPMARGTTLSQLTVVLVVAIGAMMVVHGQLTVGGLAACTLLSGRTLQPVNAIIGVWARLQSIKIAKQEFSKLLEMPSERQHEQPEIVIEQGKIVVDKLSFRYTEDKPWLFKNLSITIEPRQTIGIRGSGMSGKTTLLGLLIGLYSLTTGSICIDEQNIAEVDPHSLRKQIGYMSQVGKLFNGTILQNLTLFEEDKYYDRAMEVVAQAGLTDFIEHLPDGYDTKVANRSTDMLPNGIIQRIVIARALIRRPKIVLFDEANNAIDMQGDRYIRSMLEKLHHQCTLILVSHRPSILSLADQQYHIEDGQLRLQA